MRSKIFNNPILELARFALVGGMATLVHAALGYSVVVGFGTNGMLANVIGFGCAWWVSFFGHHMFTFQKRAQPYRAFARFIVHSLGMFLIAFVVSAAAKMTFSFIPDSFVPVIGALVVPVISFLSSKYFVFRYAT